MAPTISRFAVAAAMAISAQAFAPPACPSTTPLATDTKACPLAAPADPEFASICKPGAMGHAGGAESPMNRCAKNDYKSGEFRCACCGASLFLAATKYPGPAGDGWPAFYNNASVKSDGADHVCRPPVGQSEVVCSSCGAHLGDFFPKGVNNNAEDYYCIDGVCLLPPGAPDGKVCQPAADDQVLSAEMQEEFKFLRKLAQDSLLQTKSLTPIYA